ncbi:hypothetical protein [Lyngbya aestuarii]|uniref:hypothetical protein n=1 Tax=Lyngbya aestuarii TaxID=118322 RepID=UPI00403DD654
MRNDVAETLPSIISDFVAIWFWAKLQNSDIFGQKDFNHAPFLSCSNWQKSPALSKARDFCLVLLDNDDAR